MVDLKSRISPEFKTWLNRQKKITGIISDPVITRILANKLSGIDVTEVTIKNRRRPKKLTLRRVFETDVTDLFKEFKV
ncbi:hypothetical protein LCGC14_0588970 [marine sediment metagenome]|uniref:Uncharacterized protein n=1 Tax=marine sediment metagenome TaxID=412755 RepID=A0A0F9RDX0_9ZZZZ